MKTGYLYIEQIKQGFGNESDKIRQNIRKE